MHRRPDPDPCPNRAYSPRRRCRNLRKEGKELSPLETPKRYLPSLPAHMSLRTDLAIRYETSQSSTSSSNTYVVQQEGSSDHDAEKAWSNGARAMMELDEANIQRWKEDIDTLLVFVSRLRQLIMLYRLSSAPQQVWHFLCCRDRVPHRSNAAASTRTLGQYRRHPRTDLCPVA